jgi:hypothetical protein
MFRYRILIAVVVAGQGHVVAQQKARTATRVQAEREAAESVRISGPTLGYFFDSAQAGIVPIWGIPGAATVGQPLELGLELVKAAVAPQQDYALAEANGESGLLVLRLDPAPFSRQPLPQALTGAEKIVFSPRGTSAALYDRGAGRIQVLTGMPAEPVVSAEVDLAGIGGAPATLAVSDDGQVILVADSEGYVSLLTAGGESRYVMAAGGAPALAFLNNSHDAVIADRGRNAVYLVRDVTGSMEARSLAGERDGVSGPLAVEASRDNGRVFIANGESSSVVALDLATGLATLVPCRYPVTGLRRLSGNAVFALTEPLNGPMLVLDGDSAELRTVLVPVAGGSSG